MAQSATPSPVGAGRRIEVPEHGFALTYPDDWTVQEWSVEDVEAVFGLDEPSAGVSLALTVSGPGRAGDCGVMVDDPTVRAEPALLATFADATHEFLLRDSTVDGVERERLDLPAGPAWRFDHLADGTPVSAYLRGGRRVSYVVTCSAEDPPEDRWLSIAETFGVPA